MEVDILRAREPFRGRAPKAGTAQGLAAAYLNEAKVGEAIRSSGLGRDEVVVVTKLFND